MTKPSIVTIDFSHPFWDGVATLTLLPVILALRGWVLTLLFWWYVAPAFALPPLRIVQAVGWSLIVSLLVPQLPLERKSLGKRLSSAIGFYAVILTIGWLGTWFI